VQNHVNTGAWRRSVESGELPTARGHVFGPDDARRGAIIEQLMCAFEVDLARYGGEGAFAAELLTLGPLTADGLVRIDGGRISIPDAMRPFSRLVAQAFDAYAALSPAQHSRTI
jgi:oxygen-independent coproporphyrinogen-3 oxidase